MGSTVKDTPAHRACTMTGETQHAHANKESDSASNKQDKGSLPERFSTELTQEPTGHYKSGCLEPQALGRTKECTQREAVIRPQQAGKIDFKSLQNRPKFSSDRTWHSSKGSPQSPSGKGRARDKSKRSGKAERGNPQQLYRLSISNTRTNPTIGIAYPQQKVTPPKKLEAGHGPISGSYRFHVPSIAEREAELQQEELSYNHCFQEASSTITSTNYTSQADSTTGGTAAHQHSAPLQQQPSLRDNNNSQPSSQLLFPEFPVNRAASWQSPDKSFNGANYGTSSQKLPIFPEGDKVNTGLVPLQFQYGYPSLQDPEVDPFPCDHNSRPQEYLDIALATAHVTHNSFAFHASGERQEDTQADSQFSNKQGEGRSSYAQLPQNTQYLQSPHEAQSSMHCHKSRSKCLSNGENSVSGLHNIDQSKSTMTENPGPFNHIDSEGVASNPVEKQSCPPNIENTPNQRTLAQGSTHHVLNIAPGQNSQVLSPSKAYSSSTISTAHDGSTSLEESIPGGSSKAQSRLLESWDGANKAFSSMEPNCALYSNVNDKCQYQCQPTGEQRQPSSNNRMAWKQIQLTSAITKQNRIHLSRQLSNQKLTFPVGAFDWQESKKPHKNSTLNSFHNKRPNEAFTSRRPESVKEHNSNISSFPFEHRMESASSTMCDTRNKPVYFGVSQSQPGQYSKTNSHASSQGPPLGLTAAAYESPLPSPLQNPASTSPCSSVSSASHSPVNINSEESQALIAGQLPPVYHLTQEKAVMSLDHLNSNLHHFHTDHSRSFQSQPERLKEDTSYSHNNKGSNSNMDGSKSCQNSYGVERPPPPYSAHQLLASSLSAANLDQLDVLLTCKQCDQNFNNLASFLDHKQYCGQHMPNQNNISKCVPKIEDHRKFQPDCTRMSSSGTSFSLSRSPSDPHLSLLGLSKNGELMSDSETKGDIKDESLKLNFFNGINTLPVMLPDLEMDDAKLDSLITEALNGLGDQSDNAEIDSSFIDAFVDDDLTSNLNMKTKDSGVINSRSKHESPSDQKSQTEGKNLFDTNRDSMSETKHIPGAPEKTHQGFKREDKAKSKEVTPLKKVSLSFEKFTEEKEWAKEEIKTTDSTGEKTKIDSRFILSRKFSERCKLKSFQQHSSLFMSSLSQTSSANWSPAAPRVSVKEGKRRKAGGGTWSKELIHKIVQQKNKPHRLHVKGTKNLQFSLVTERLTPAAQSPKFGEYDYVSDSDDESEPLRFISRGRLGHANRCKYTYEKEYKGKCTYSKDKRRDWAEKGESLLWKQQSKDSSDVKVEEQISPSSGKESSNQRLRRRNSRSSSSSELSESASISCESITSPKINERTDSESDKALAVRRKSSSNMPQCNSFEPDSCKTSPLNMPKEPTTQTALSSHPFSKNVKRYGSAKFLLSHERKEDLPSSRGLCFKDRGSESTANLPDIAGIQTQAVNHSPDAGREKHSCAAVVNLTEKAENPSSIERNDIKDNSTYLAFAHKQSNSTGTPVDFHTDDGHSKLTAAEVMSGMNVPDRKNGIKQEQCDISTPDKALYTGNEPNKPSNYSETLQKSSEVSATPAFEMIGSPIYINKDERHNIDCDLQPKTSQNCTANVEGACLCPMDMQDPAEQDKEHVVSYTIEPDQSLIKSPLSFDTSSMFGDLTVGGFDNSLYTDVSKESFHTFFTRNDKRDLFESPPSPHLGLKDWDIITDVPPVPPLEIPHFKELSEKEITKKCDSNHIQLNLPDKIMEDSNFISGFSEDELEIKRIVTELETQLQIVKIDSPEMHLNEHSRHLSKSNTAPLPLDHNAGNGQSSIQVDDVEEHGGLPVSSLTQDPHLTLWSSPSHLVLLEAPQDLHTPVHNDHSSPEHFSIKVDPIPTKYEAKDLQLQEMNGTDEIKDPATDCPKSEEMLENEIYAENLMKSLEVISDSIFNKDSLTAEIQESNLTDFLKQDQPCEEFPDARVKQGEKEGSTDDKSQKSEEHKTLDFSEEKSHWSAETRSQISPQSSDPESIIKTCEPKTKLCDDVPVNENVIGISESQKFNDTDLLFQSKIIEEKIKDDNSLLPVASDNCKITKDDGNVLRDREQPLLPQLFLSSTVQSDDKESTVVLYPPIFSADRSSTVPVKPEEHNPPLQSLEEFHTVEENFEDASNSDSSKKSSNPEASSKNGAKDFTTERSTSGWDLLKSGETGKFQSVAINEDRHKAASFRWNTPRKTVTGSIAKVNCKRPKNFPYIHTFDQEAATETLYQVNMEKTTDVPRQVNEEKKIDMLSQVDKQITNVSNLVNQDRDLDVISQNNQERATGVPGTVNQVMTLDMITLINQVNKIPEVSSDPLSTEAEAKDNEKTELMLKEHAQILEKEPPVLTSLIEETAAGPECAPTPMQGLCALAVLPLHAVSTDNAVKAEETTNTVPQQELCPALSPLLPCSGDHSQVQQNHSHTIWANYDKLSPDSEHRRHLLIQDEQNTKHCAQPASMMSGMPSGMTDISHMDIGNSETKKSDSNSITSDLPLITTLEQSDFLLKSPEKTIKNGLLESLPELEKTPLIFSQISASPLPPECNNLTENVEDQDILSRSPKDNPDRCRPLASNAISSVDGSSSEMPVDAETALCLYSNDSSMQNIETQSSGKSSCATVDVPDLDVFHPTLENIVDMDLQLDGKKAETEKIDLQSPLSEQNALFCKQDVSDNQETLQPVVSCPDAAFDAPLYPNEAMKGEGQCASKKMDANRDLNDSRKRCVVQKMGTVQEAIQCEICFACFRTVPGLKRHKAMKHFTKKNGNTIKENLAGNASICKDNPVLLDPEVCLRTENSNSLPSETNVPSFISNEKEVQVDTILAKTVAIETIETVISGVKENKTLSSVAKTKKNSKALKNKETDNQNGCFEFEVGRSSPFSDEQLSMMKTDILQAISSSISTEQHESNSALEKQDKVNTDCPTEKVPESFPLKLIDISDQIDITMGHTEQHNMHKQDIAVEQVEAEIEQGQGLESEMSGCDRTTGNPICSKSEESGENFNEVKETCEQKETCFEDSICGETLADASFLFRIEKKTCITDKVDPEPCGFKAPSVHSPGPDPDLEALLDDERTFSQLFPRDEEIIRKKCTKVYGKKNKKQNSDSSLVSGQSLASTSSDKNRQYSERCDDEILINKVKDHSEYKTAFVDDATMLDMCHESTVKNDCEKIAHCTDQERDNEHSEVGSGHFQCLREDPVCETATEWSNPKDQTDIDADRAQSPETPVLCKIEDPAIPCPPQHPSSPVLHSSETPTQENAPHFQSIDIQNLNTKFQLPDIQFLEPGEEVPVSLPVDGDDVTISQTQEPTKKPAERRGKKRVEEASKPKDRQYKCKACFTWFLTLGGLNLHKLSHNPYPSPTCYMCVQRKFSSREQLIDHLREKHAKNKAGLWTCGMCLKEICDVCMYNEHLREHATKFARKGQTQSSILGLPGCFMQETAVKNFITSIMQHQSSKSSEEESVKTPTKESTKTVKENVAQKPKPSEGDDNTRNKTKVHSGGSGKRSAPILPDIPNKADVPQKNVEMHPNCKDPSRDCHHCGKQFPKPFKLQRHLVVHSLQKLFLCSKCPISYQDANELKEHLKSEHEEIDEPDSKHTTLYTCELCADVMHVIKKSFVCSTCNYTFSKKEQYDRHMEKHLTGGNKIFKFRGVVRPSKPSSSSNDGECDRPPAKKQKCLTKNSQGDSSANSITNATSEQFDQSTESLVPRSMSTPTSDFTGTSNTPSSDLKDADIKTEDINGDISDMEYSQLKVVSEPMCLTMVNEHCPTSEPDAQPRKVCEGDEDQLSDIKEENHLLSALGQKPSSLLSSALTECLATKNEASSSVATLHLPSEDLALAATMQDNVQPEDLSKSTQSIEESNVFPNENLLKISVASDVLHEDSETCGHNDDQRKSPENSVEQTGLDEKRDPGGHLQKYETETKESKIEGCAEQVKERQGKEEVFKLSNNTNCSLDENPRLVARGLGVTQSAKNYFKPAAIISGRGEEKELVRPKKRKEMKLTQSSKVPSSATRENQDVDNRNRKKPRVQSPSKCIWTGGYRKADVGSDYPVLSSVRDEMASNKILPKHKAGGLNLQPKRNSSDSNPPKKAEASRHVIGTYKGRKGVPGKPLHSPISKTSVPVVNNSLYKYRPLPGRPVESHSYRTAESQNNLLSQLFGQKLTSFKIPLRKDTSEALN